MISGAQANEGGCQSYFQISVDIGIALAATFILIIAVIAGYFPARKAVAIQTY